MKLLFNLFDDVFAANRPIPSGKLIEHLGWAMFSIDMESLRDI